jgi:hypothetical protein
MRTTYTAAVEVATKHALEVEQLTSAFSQYSPKIGTSPRGWLELRISLRATSLAQACSRALAVASAATGAEAIACEVMTENESDKREEVVPQPRGSTAPVNGRPTRLQDASPREGTTGAGLIAHPPRDR